MELQSKELADLAKDLLAPTLEILRGVSATLPNPIDTAKGLRDAAFGACIHVAGADGPINDSEAAIINYMLDSNDPKQLMEAWRNTQRSDPKLASAMIGSLAGAMFFNSIAREQAGYQYIAVRDPIVRLVSLMGQAVIGADSDISPLEARALSMLTASLGEKAMELERSKSPEALPEIVTSNSAVASTTQQPSVVLDDPIIELRQMIGLSSVKLEVETLANLAKVFSLRKSKNLPVPDMSFHLVFSGNPGTGKTTVARILARVYGTLGLLSKGHLVEVDRAGLVASYVGQTAPKVKDAVSRARGGVLFIDEAYSLAEGGDNDFGKEALDTLIKEMEDHRADLVIVVAGYTDKMENFLNANPGLRSRFARTIQFPDYSSAEMAEIFLKLAKDAHYDLDHEAVSAVTEAVANLWNNRGKSFGNGRDVRKLFERVVSAQADRIVTKPELSDTELMSLSREDIVRAAP